MSVYAFREETNTRIIVDTVAISFSSESKINNMKDAIYLCNSVLFITLFYIFLSTYIMIFLSTHKIVFYIVK